MHAPGPFNKLNPITSFLIFGGNEFFWGELNTTDRISKLLSKSLLPLVFFPKSRKKFKTTADLKRMR